MPRLDKGRCLQTSCTRTDSTGPSPRDHKPKTQMAHKTHELEDRFLLLATNRSNARGNKQPKPTCRHRREADVCVNTQTANDNKKAKTDKPMINGQKEKRQSWAQTRCRRCRQAGPHAKDKHKRRDTQQRSRHEIKRQTTAHATASHKIPQQRHGA